MSSASDDIRLLQFDGIAETADLAAMYAAGAVDAALDGDIPLLECALRCMVTSVNATLLTWREMRSSNAPIGAASDGRRAT